MTLASFPHPLNSAKHTVCCLISSLKKQFLVELSDTLGTFTYRGVKDKNVIGVRPLNVNVPNDPASI